MNNSKSEEKKYIPLTRENKKQGIEKSFVDINSFQIHTFQGVYVNTSNRSYSQIYKDTEYQLVNENEYLGDEYISEILSFLEDNCAMIKEYLSYYDGVDKNGS